MAPSRGKTGKPSLYRADAGLSVRVIQDGLETSVVGRTIFLHRELESTNSTASLLAREGGAEGTVVLADAQRGGKGRMGRTWVSPPGCNIYLSAILNPDGHSEKPGLWTMGAGLAASRGITAATGLTPLLKWPNDLRIHGKKVGGILIEAVFRGNRAKNLILGLGINVNMPAEAFPAKLRTSSTSLSEVLGKKVDRNHLCRTILVEVERTMEALRAGNTGPIVSGYRALSETLDRRVKVLDRGGEYYGRAADFTEHGELLLRLDSGETRKIRSEDIVHLRGTDASGD